MNREGLPVAEREALMARARQAFAVPPVVHHPSAVETISWALNAVPGMDEQQDLPRDSGPEALARDLDQWIAEKYPKV